MQLKRIGLWSLTFLAVSVGTIEMSHRKEARQATALMEARLAQQQFDHKQVTCLAENAYYESRSDSRQGMIAVSQVVMNRVEIIKATPCKVVFERNARGCQFSWTCNSQRSSWDRRSYRTALTVAHDVYYGKTKDIVNGATHYHTKAIKPYWSRSRKFVRLHNIDSHIYYRSLENKWKSS